VKKCIYKYFYFFLFINQITFIAFGQVTGIPLIQNYGPKEYKQHEQNWTIIQDNRGIMYFGNSHGLLEYDGISWRFIKTTNPDIVRSLAVDDSNNIFIGGYNYFGRIITDSLKQFEYKSLSDQLGAKHKKFNNVWNVIVANDGTYFQTDSALFKWTNNKFKIWKTSAPGNRSFLVNDTLYKIQDEKGLTYLKDSIFVSIKGGEFFAQNKIYSMKSIGHKKSLIGTRTKGLFILSNITIVPFKTEIDEYLKKNKLTDIELLKDNNIAIATREGGLAIINQNGQLVQYINKKNGLAGDIVWDMYPDNQFGLWLALNNGISRIELPSPVTHFGESSGIHGNVETIAGHQGSIFIATSLGLYFFSPNQNTAQLKKVPGFRPYKIISVGKNLISSGYDSGIYEYSNNKMKFINNYTAYSFSRSELDSSRLYIGLEDAVASIYYRNNEWIDEGHLHLISSPVRDIIETEEGNLWLRTSGPTIAKISFSENKLSWEKAKIEYFDVKNGLISSEQNYIFKFENKIFFGNKNRLLEYNEHENKFIPFTEMNNIISDISFSVYGFKKDYRNNYWLLLSSTIGYSVGLLSFQSNGKYLFETDPFLQLFGRYYYSVYPDLIQKNITWFGGPDGIIRYDSNIKKDYTLSYPCLVRRVLTQNDSLIWLGGNTPAELKTLEYNNNALRFEFAATYFENEKSNLFQYYLEGFDKNWSHWTNEPKANYTNIPEGRYLFRVRAKNIYNVISNEANYAFKILPPWYRTTWAYVFYSFFIIGIVFGLIKLRSFKLEYEKKQLENIIEERTDEIQIKNKQLEEQSVKLKEMDEIKSRFFANISHELRTPLTLIKGPTEEIINKTYPGDKEKALKSVLINTDRMLRLINELLDLSKLESGSMKLNTRPQNLSEYISVIVNSFMPLAESRNIKLQYIKSENDIELYFDRDKLEIVLINLLSNAFKFTPEGGYITVALHTIKNDPNSQDAVEISVHDSGIGIPSKDLDKIFDRFVQANNFGNTRLEGSGIGLALAKEFVELHHGKITAASSVEEGTEFDIVLQMGKDHLKAEEIVEKEESEEFPDSGVQLNIAELESEIQTDITSENEVENGEKCLVLIVEDNAEVRNYIKLHLKNDYEILEAENGKTGLELAQENLPDLIVSDVMMPEVDGYMLTEAIKNVELTSHIPIILLTAKASDEERIEGLETGADAYMAKPFNAKELEVRVKKLIENRNNLRDKFKKEFLLEPNEENTVSLDDDFIKRVHDKIEEKMPNPDFNVEVLLKDFALGQRQFTRKVIALTGQTPVQFIRIMRLKKAMNLIKQKTGTVSQIAFGVGFSNLSYFSKCFQQQFGKLPSEIIS
jgi:signal transduction histidine kinase/DNA-binding response OmpR family regulator/ligand-binding sensor domain-containing protein